MTSTDPTIAQAQPHPRVTEGLERCGITYSVFQCDPEFADTAIFCEHYGFPAEETANTIIAAGKADPVKYACGVILATTKLDVNKKICGLLGIKRASFASSDQTMELTGMLIGGVTPFGLPDIPIYLDSRLMNCKQLVLGGGNRSTKILLAPCQLLKLPGSEVVEGLALER